MRIGSVLRALSLLTVLLIPSACVVTAVEPQVQPWTSKLVISPPNTPTEGKCRIGIYITRQGVLTFAEPNASKAGMLPDDRIVQVDSTSVHNDAEIVAAIQLHAPSDRVEIVVERGSRQEKLPVDCLNGHRAHDLWRELAAAASERRWDDCMEASRELEALEGLHHQLTQAHLKCYEGKHLPGHRPSPELAQLRFRMLRSWIRQLAFFPDAFEKDRGRIQSLTSWFSKWGYDDLAADLLNELNLTISYLILRTAPESQSPIPEAQEPALHPDEPKGIRLRHGETYDVRSGGFVQYAKEPKQVIPWGESLARLKPRLSVSNDRAGAERIEEEPSCSSESVSVEVKICRASVSDALGVWLADFGDTQWLFEPELHYRDGRFFKFTLGFDSDAFPFLRKTFEEALGAPSRKSTERIRNRMGEAFVQTTVSWDLPTTKVVAVNRGLSRVDRGSAMISYRRISEEIDQNGAGEPPF